MTNIFDALKAKAKGQMTRKEFNLFASEHKFDDCE